MPNSNTGEHSQSATIIVCTHDGARWSTLSSAVSATSKQMRFDDELLIIVDNNDTLLARCREQLANCRVIANCHRGGLSGARNTGIEYSRNPIVVFLDDDATPLDGWLDALRDPYSNSRVFGVGGNILPRWPAGQPGWFPEEFLWVVGCVHRGLRCNQQRVRNLIGANMSFRKSSFSRLGGFVETMGRVASNPLGCEETEFCIRLAQADHNMILLYNPSAQVEHYISHRRCSMRYFAKRCWAEGLSKAEVLRRVGKSHALSEERYYVSHVLPRAIWRGLAESAHGDLPGLVRSTVIVAGLALTACGYCVGLLSRTTHGADPPVQGSELTWEN